MSKDVERVHKSEYGCVKGEGETKWGLCGCRCMLGVEHKHRTMLFSRCVKGKGGGKERSGSPLFRFHIFIKYYHL